MKKGFTVGVAKVRHQYLLKIQLNVLVFYEISTNLKSLKVKYLTTDFIPFYNPKCY